MIAAKNQIDFRMENIPMAYDENIDHRVQKIIAQWKGVVTKKMFGGVCHQLNGNIVSGVHKDKLILRLGPDQAEDALKQKNVVPFDITGRPMKGWVMVAKEGFTGEEALEAWLDQAKAFVKTLPPK